MLERLKALARRRVIRDGAWAAAGQIISAVVLLVATRLTTEIITNTSIVGTASLLLGIVTMARFVVFAPLLQSQFRFYSEFAAHGEVGRLRRMTGRVLWPSLIGFAALTMLAGAVHSYRSGTSWWVYVAAAGLLVVEVGRGVELGFLQAARRQKAVTAVNVAEAIARPGLMVLTVWFFGPSPAKVMLGYLAGQGLVYVALLAGIHREGVGDAPAVGHAARGPTGRDVWRYALPLAPLAIVGTITSIGDRYLLGAVVGTAAVGVYTVTYGLMSQPFSLAQGIIYRTLSPIYFKAVSEGDRATERRAFQAWIWATVGVSVAGLGAIILLRRAIARLLLAEEYRTGVDLMPWIAAGYALYSVGAVFEARLYARKLTGRVLLGNTIVAVVAIVAPLALMYKWSMLGVAMACPIYFGTLVVAMWWLSRAGAGGKGEGTGGPTEARGR